MANLPQPDKKIPYPVAHDETGGSLFVYGSASTQEKLVGVGTKTKKKVVLFCPGFPDDHESFMPVASRLAKEKDCLVGVICLPGFDDRPEKPWKSHWKDGFSFEEMAAAFKEGAKALLVEATESVSIPREQVDYTVVIHDWAVAVGMIQVNRAVEEEAVSKPTLSLVPNQIVLMDIGLPFHPKDEGKPKLRSPMCHDKDTPLRTVITEVAYRLNLAIMFFLYRYVSGVLAIIAFVIGSSFLKLAGLAPTKYIDNKLIEDRKPNLFRLSYTSYPYYRLTLAILNGKIQCFDHATLPILDDIPVLFMYGRVKNINFHEDKLVECLNEIENQGGRSRSVVVENGGHWFHLQQPELFFQEVCKFLASSS